MKIAHLTSAHSRFDTRIFLKQCRSLASAGHDVSLIVADGLPNDERDGVRIIGLSKAKSRLGRIFVTRRAVLEKALDLGADVYHLHDPELLLIARSLLRNGKKVIFDAHEDLPKQILTKPYLWSPARRAIASLSRIFERIVCRQLTAVVTATPAIRIKFESINPICIDINNYPLQNELVSAERLPILENGQVCYVGGLSAIRGASQMVSAIGKSEQNIRLAFAGTIGEPHLATILRSTTGWGRVDELGHLSRTEVRELLAESVAGLVTFLPAPNHLESQPNKMFEYMSAGVPVIASNFPLWREIVEENSCGICVDPLDSSAIARAIDWLVTHPDEAWRMGRNGRNAVEIKYNWGVEEAKLLRFYASIFINSDIH